MENYLVFISITLLFVFVLFGYVFIKNDLSVSKFKEYFMSVETGGGRGALFGIFAVIIVVSVLGFILNTAYGVDRKVEYFKETVIFAGLDYTQKTSPMCYSDGVNDRITSNIGIKQNFVSYGDVYLNGKYTHHSCAVNRDRYGYDALGVTVEWKFGH